MLIRLAINLAIFGACTIGMILPAQAQPSFNCSNASTLVENLICDNPALAQLDSDLADAYKTALRDATWSSANKRIRSEQQAWLKRRDRCDSGRCLQRLYHQRIGALYAELHDDGGDADDGGGAMAGASDPGRMMAQCRDRAAQVFHLRHSNVDTKYEGQRTDGTHAVNGTAYLRDTDETFQCSFNASGDSIMQFVVN